MWHLLMNSNLSLELMISKSLVKKFTENWTSLQNSACLLDENVSCKVTWVFSFSSIALWGVMKKKPLTTIENAHSGNPDDPTTLKSNWITSVTSLQHTDLVASGSVDSVYGKYNFSFKLRVQWYQ